MKITALRTVAVQYPYWCQFGAAYPGRSLGALAIFLDTDAGLTGEFVLLAFAGKRLAVLREMVLSLDPLAVGRDPTFSEAFCSEATEDARHLGASGVTLIGIGAVEGAMLDLRAKAAGLPVHRLLGALNARVPAYYSSGLWNPVPLDELQRTAANIVANGYRAMKLRVAAGRVADEVARVRAVREAVGADVKLMVDAGQRLDLEQAVRLGRAIEEFRIEWLEEPVRSDDHETERRVAAQLDIPIASGENVHSFLEFEHMIERQCADVLMPDLQRIGGPRQFLKVAQRAAAAGLPISSHLAPEMSLALLATLPNAKFLEVMPWPTPLYAERIEVVDGYALAPERPGWGYALDQDALRRFAIN